jgi:hypothetical protein
VLVVSIIAASNVENLANKQLQVLMLSMSWLVSPGS